MTGSLIGAIVRGEHAIFPHGNDMLMPGDRAIIFAEAARVSARSSALCDERPRPLCRALPAGCGSASTSAPSPT